MEIVKFIAKNDLEVEVENAEMKGTKKWFDSFMKNSTFVIKNTWEDTPAMYIKHNYNGTYVYKFICERRNFDTNYQNYRFSQSRDYAYVYACRDSFFEQRKTLFDFQLTPLVKKEVEELISKAVEAFAEWYEN